MTSRPTNTITLPLDDRLELLARKWVEPSTGAAWMRLLGVQALGAFKSETSIALLKALVHDPGGIGTDSFGGPSDFKGEAAATLAKWGIPIPPPPPPDRLNSAAVSSRPVRVEIDGAEVSFKGVSATRIIVDRAYARACTLSAALHVKMGTYRLHDTSGVGLERDELTIYMPIDSHMVWIGDTVEDAAHPSRLIKGEGFFPIRYIAEKLGATVRWDARRHMVLIRPA